VLGLGCFTPLSTILLLYRSGQFYWDSHLSQLCPMILSYIQDGCHAMTFVWLKNRKSLKIFRTTGWKETKFDFSKSCIVICGSVLGQWVQSWKKSNLVSFHPVVLKIFKDFLFFNQTKVKNFELHLDGYIPVHWHLSVCPFDIAIV
jgi:hypothetical protein